MDEKRVKARMSAKPNFIHIAGGYERGTRKREIKVRGRKIYTLAYADDVAVMAEDEDGMKGLLGRLERYLDRKSSELNIKKTKIMRCRNGGGRWKKANWRWKGEVIEEVREFSYLGYEVQGRQDGHLRKRVRKEAAVLGQVWGIGKRKFGGDWGKRVWLLYGNRLVWLIIGYGVEIWGWKERGGIENLQERYLRWVLGVERSTPGYMIRGVAMGLIEGEGRFKCVGV